jgi:methionyl aminopeptidase
MITRRKNSREAILKIRRASRIVSDTLDMISKYVTVGRTTNELDMICHDYILRQDGYPSCLHYQGFPKSICTSINDVACHGIPNKTDILKVGDIINIDIAINKDGYHGDGSRMFTVGQLSDSVYQFIQKAKEARDIGISIIKNGISLYDIAFIIDNYCNLNKLYIASEYCGHGIGKEMHEEPSVFHHIPFSRSEKMYLKKYILHTGDTLTVEPIVNQLCSDTFISQDGWTVKTLKGDLSAQWEHTILVLDHGYEILTN